MIYFQLFSVLPKQSAYWGFILLFLTEWPLFKLTILRTQTWWRSRRTTSHNWLSPLSCSHHLDVQITFQFVTFWWLKSYFSRRFSQQIDNNFERDFLWKISKLNDIWHRERVISLIISGQKLHLNDILMTSKQHKSPDFGNRSAIFVITKFQTGMSQEPKHCIAMFLLNSSFWIL